MLGAVLLFLLPSAGILLAVLAPTRHPVPVLSVALALYPVSGQLVRVDKMSDDGKHPSMP